MINKQLRNELVEAINNHLSILSKVTDTPLEEVTRVVMETIKERNVKLERGDYDGNAPK